MYVAFELLWNDCVVRQRPVVFIAVVVSSFLSLLVPYTIHTECADIQLFTPTFTQAILMLHTERLPCPTLGFPSPRTNTQKVPDMNPDILRQAMALGPVGKAELTHQASIDMEGKETEDAMKRPSQPEYLLSKSVMFSTESRP